MSGWIKLHRRLLEWEWYDDTNAVRLFLHLMLTVNYEPKRWHGMTINAGQIVTGRKTLAEQTSLSEQQVRTALDKLESTNEITITKSSKYSVITITNWATYQDINQQNNQQVTNNQPTSNQQITTTKETKNIRRKEESIVYARESEEFWREYPRKDGSKAKAVEIINKLLKEGNDYDAIIRGVRAYRDACEREGTERRYIAHATTWLNQRRWESDYSAKPSSKPKGKGELADEYIKAGLAEYISSRPF